MVEGGQHKSHLAAALVDGSHQASLVVVVGTRHHREEEQNRLVALPSGQHVTEELPSCETAVGGEGRHCHRHLLGWWWASGH